jgi:hypothetical protein
MDCLAAEYIAVESVVEYIAVDRRGDWPINVKIAGQ